MMKKLKYRLWYLSYLCLSKFMRLLFFVCEIARHPIKNISIWLVGLLPLLIYRNLPTELKGKEMFYMSAGLVSIITFISNFLERQTIDTENKDNFYLGYNIKKLIFHNNFWFKSFNELPVKPLSWIIAILPIISIGVELDYGSRALNEMRGIIVAHIKYIDSIWLSAFIVGSFYCIALLIETIDLSRKNFSQSYLYKITNKFEKLKIKMEIEQDFEEIFNNIFNIKNILELENNYYSNVERVTNYIYYIFSKGNEVSASDSEIIEFYNIAYECERNKINNLLNKVYKYAKCDTNKKIKYFIDNYLLRSIMKLLELYYHIKWNTIIKLNVLPIEIVNIAIQDLRVLLEIETKLHGNKEYENIFWGIYKSNEYYFREDKKESNLCISKILAILKEKFRDINFINQCNDMTMMMNLFDVLNRIDSQTKDDRCFPPIFKILFRHIIDDRSKENAFVESFLTRMKNKRLPEYLISESNNVSKEILMSGDSITNDTLKYLLNFMHLEDIIVILIFRLAYSERSDRPVMAIDEFKVWKTAIEKVKRSINIDDLEKSKFIDKLCDEISTSDVSHFIFEQFVRWMWSSLFQRFDENKYEEFVKLGADGSRQDFSLDRYIIVRLLLCDFAYRPIYTYRYKRENQIKMDNELCNIKDILDYEHVKINC